MSVHPGQADRNEPRPVLGPRESEPGPPPERDVQRPAAMKATHATLCFGSQVAKLTSVEVHADRAVFHTVRGVASSYARMTFKVGGSWFDVEGVVLAGGGGVCELRFATLPANTARRLDETIREPPKPTSTRSHSQAPRPRRVAIPLPAA
jgi:hypothetical protein